MSPNSVFLLEGHSPVLCFLLRFWSFPSSPISLNTDCFSFDEDLLLLSFFYNLHRFECNWVVNCYVTIVNVYTFHYVIEPEDDLLILNLHRLLDVVNVVHFVVYNVDSFDSWFLIFDIFKCNFLDQVLLLVVSLQMFVVLNFNVTNFYIVVRVCYLHLEVSLLLKLFLSNTVIVF